MVSCLQPFSFDGVYRKENDIGSLRICEDLSVSDESVRIHETTSRSVKAFDYQKPPKRPQGRNVIARYLPSKCHGLRLLIRDSDGFQGNQAAPFLEWLSP